MAEKAKPFFPPPKLSDVPENKDRLRVARPNEDGEIVVRGAVHGREFRDGSDAPTRPERLGPEPTEPTGTLGWLCVRCMDYRLAKRAHQLAIRRGASPPAEFEKAEAAYWDYYAWKLTREERSALASGRDNAIIRPLEPVWERGDKLEITRKLTARVDSTTRTLKGWRTEFVIEDFRTFFMKSTVGGSSQPKTDEEGFAADPTAAEIERARLDGAYTQAEAQAVPDGGEVLEDKLHRRIHAEQSMADAMLRGKQRKQVDLVRMEARLEEARRKHWATGHIERQIERFKAKEPKRKAS